MRSIYVVDDDPIFTFIIKKLLELSAFSDTILTFENGEEALKDLKPKLENGIKTPSVIFLDINMPVMDGWQFLDAYVQLPHQNNIAIYIVSSTINPADHDKSKEYEVVKDLVVKPLNLNKLKEIKELNVDC